MLPESHNRAYRNFLSILLEFQELIDSDRLDFVSINHHFLLIQQFFPKQITILTSAEIDDSIAAKWQSIHTEIYRAWRLLETEIVFLRSSKQTETTKKRLNSLRDRLKQIINYCQGMLTSFTNQ